MKYKGIETEDKWIDGSWYTYFYSNGDLIKTVQRCGNFGDDETKKIINREIIRFI